MPVPPIIIHGNVEQITITYGEKELEIPPDQGKKFQYVLVNLEGEEKTIEVTKAWEIRIE